MRNLRGQAAIGDVGGIVGSVMVMGVAAIILLTASVPIIGDVDQIAVQSKSSGHCTAGGERFDRVVEKGAHTSAQDAWAASPDNRILLNDDNGRCKLEKVITQGRRNVIATNQVTTPAVVYTPKGTEIATTVTAIKRNRVRNNRVTADFVGGANGWTAQSRSLGALSGGNLIGLLFGAMGILIPAGALSGLAYFGSQMVQKHIGGNTLEIALGATMSVIIVASLLPEIFAPLDQLFIALDGNRFYVYGQGIGQIAGVLGNFLGIALVSGLIGLGSMLWKAVRRGGNRQTDLM